MNVIEAKLFQSRYTDESHLALWVDNEPLDRLLDRWVPGQEIEGLVPAWLEWMIDRNEQDVAQSRMRLPREGCVRVPLLMCPDDLDFSCSIVIADLEASESTVKWRRLGYDQTASNDPEKIGRDVRWFDGLTELCFERSQYQRCIQLFVDENKKAQQGGHAKTGPQA